MLRCHAMIPGRSPFRKLASTGSSAWPRGSWRHMSRTILPSAVDRSGRWWRWLTTGGVLTTAAFLTWVARRAPEDDVLIVYRYAARFASHKGLTFNDGEYVEGYTSLLWTL